MKKVCLLAGILTALLLALHVSGWADRGREAQAALQAGNALYEADAYEEALAAYEDGLALFPDDEDLHFAAAQSAYALGDGETALPHYEQAGERQEGYLRWGNLYALTAEALGNMEGMEGTEDMEAAGPEAQIALYAQALSIYQEGIARYPMDLALKYNYEWVLARMEATQEEMEPESQENQEGEEEQESQESEEGDESQEQQEGESQESQQGQDESASEQGLDDQEGQGEENSEAAQEEESGEAAQGEESGEAAQGEENGEAAPDREAIARILAMLEAQEEQSLKNNQAVVAGKEDIYGW